MIISNYHPAKAEKRVSIQDWNTTTTYKEIEPAYTEYYYQKDTSYNELFFIVFILFIAIIMCLTFYFSIYWI